MNLQTLQTIVIALSTVVLLEATWIGDHGISQPQETAIPETYLQEQLDSVSLTGVTPTDFAARVWLEPTPDAQLTVWLEAWRPIQTAELRLEYEPKQLSVEDAISEEEGVQIAFGIAPQYWVNEVDSRYGQVSITAHWPDSFVGTVKIASIPVTKKTRLPSRIRFQYLPNSHEGSFVVTPGDNQNVLAPPDELTF